MYLWVVIATFITILLSYNLSVRPDMDRAYAETRASVAIAKFRALHNGVRDYLISRAPQLTGLTRVDFYPGDGVNISKTDGDGSQYKVLTYDLIKDYLPIGYAQEGKTLDDVANITGGGKIVSKVFCFADANTDAQCVSGVDGSCCHISADGATGAKIYVVTFTQMPTRWINKVSNLPNADMMAAMAHVHGYGRLFGYTETRGGKLLLSGGKLVQNYDDYGNPIGAEKLERLEIYKAIKNDADFQKSGCNKENVHCLFEIEQIYG